MLLVNLSYIPGREFDVIGIVKGADTVKKEKSDAIVGFSSLFKRDRTEYYEMLINSPMSVRNYGPPPKGKPGNAELMDKARSGATDRMIAAAEGLGADAIINLKYEATDARDGSIEMLAYGTAVRFKQNHDLENTKEEEGKCIE